jgi:glycerate 2-kinase
MTVMDYKAAAEQIFLAGVERVLPDRLIKKSMTLSGDLLRINDLSFDLRAFSKLIVTGAGKASALMGAAVEKILGSRISVGHIVVKYGHGCKLDRITVTEAGHPVPDPNGFRAAADIIKLCNDAGERDLVLCLLSGGGSALLPDFPEGSSPEEIMKVNDLLVRCGASIREINTVRKHLSAMKGGHISRAVYPGTLISLILSDVTGDPLDVIASGPTVPDPTTFADAINIIVKYGISGNVPETIMNHLYKGLKGKVQESPKPGDPALAKTYNILVGNNRLALESCSRKARELNFNPFIISDCIEGDITEVADFIFARALDFRRDKEIPKPVCLLFGGEPAVKVTGDGRGGRNQHLALLLSERLKGYREMTLLSAGTDGTDGPTFAAGAVVDCNTWPEAEALGMVPEKYLEHFDSFSFFSKAGGQVVTGPTMTNVMDIIVVLME